ncbi:sulfatase family protein [Carboxylicivirga linearis]|uniref:Sulfatase-like hydrolase/transferase n=1 Tax=Carboxylicivirga linearis TaxID=1628157 RepID=A0ABS5JSX2_9BACT|nr:arylsulfatase [Carboxylicivirga linearis]MBS2097561.1 sulfatase-like hydrolase/transferase [Carboxylicivirga linearis]
MISAIKILSFTALMYCLISCSQGKRQEADKLPNVVFILADDIGYGDLACYGGKLPTPNLDQLAADGIRFTDAHAPAALCAPSRFSMLTGSYPYRSYSAGGAWNTNSPSIFSDPHEHTNAGRKITVAEIMQKVGYRTAFFGKSHLGGDIKDKDGNLIRKQNEISKMDFTKGVHNSINEYGFDYSYSLPSGIQHEPFAFFENGNFSPFDPNKAADNSSTKFWKNGRYAMKNGISEIVEHARQAGVGDMDYNSSQTGIMLIDKAIDFIDHHLKLNQQQNEEKPFLLYFASQAIHVPHTPPDYFEDDKGNLNIKVNGITGGATGDFVYELDLQIGRIIKKLENEGLTGNTIVFFTSDNGALWPNICDFGNPEHDNNGPWRGYKAEVYEGGHRVPFIAKWPGKISQGRISDETVLAQDWVATMYELTQQTMEDDQAMDCTSLLPLLLEDPGYQKPLHPFILYQAGYAHDGAIREGNWVLLVNRKNEATELYNLKEDPEQLKNVIALPENNNRVQRLKQTFLKYNDHNNNTQEPRTTKAFSIETNS